MVTDTAALIEELRIGGLMDGPDQFARVAAVTEVPNGDVWVADGQQLRIRRYDREGRFLGEVGSRGEGPGEFRSIGGMGTLADSLVAVWDAAAARVSLFGVGGAYVNGFRVPGGVMIAEGRALFRTDTLDRAWVLSGTPPRSFTWRLYGMDGSELGSIPEPDGEGDGAGWARQRYGASQMYPFSDRTVTTPSPCGYLVSGRTADYSLEVTTLEGTRSLVRRTWEPVKVDADERRAFRALEDVFADRRGEDARPVPGEKPAFWALWTDDGCRIWVSRHTRAFRVPETPDDAEARAQWGNPPLEWWEDRIFDVLGPDGRIEAAVRLPNRQSDLVFADGSTLWVVEYGAYDEPYVVRYRMETR